MSDSSVFNSEMAGLGGKLDWEDLRNPARETFFSLWGQASRIVASAREHLPRLPAIHFDFVNNNTINAWAFKADERYYIGVTSGAIYMLQLVFSRMLADRGVFSNIGDASVEEECLPLLSGLTPDANEMYKAGTLPFPVKDNRRKSFCDHLFFQAFLFLVGHEVAHITHGHVDYLKSKQRIPLFAEFNSISPDEAMRIERQTLEADADRRSIYSRVDSSRVTAQKPEPIIVPWFSVPINVEQLLFSWNFAVNCLFRLFGDLHFVGTDLKANFYPPFPLRRAMAARATVDFVNRRWKANLIHVAAKAAVDALTKTENIFHLITGLPLNGVGINNALGLEGAKYEEALTECWNNGLRDALSPFSYEWEPEPPVPPQSTAFTE